MASRFMFQKLSSEMSRSTSLLGAHASSARAGTTRTGIPGKILFKLTGTLSNLFHGNAVNHPSNRGIHDFSWRRICKAARQAEDAACKPKSVLPAYDSIKKDVDTTICLLAFSCLGWIYIFNRTPPGGSSGTTNGPSVCSHCCNCKCHGPNSKVEQD